MTRFATMIGILVAAGGLACSTPLEEFVCGTAADCASEGVAGVCQPNGFCSFADPICASGQRYGEASGSDSNECVAPLVDGGVESSDADPSAPDAAPANCDAFSFEPLNVNGCKEADLKSAIVLNEAGTYLLFTDDGLLVGPADMGDIFLEFRVDEQQGGNDLFVLTTEAFEIGSEATVIVRGPRALAVVSAGPIQITGRLRATAKDDLDGPGSLTNCGPGRGSDGEVQASGSISAGSGGGGGGFGSPGGNGAAVLDSGEPAPQGGTGLLVSDLVPLRGGCRGGDGSGNGLQGVTGGKAGGGGGAIQLVSASDITVSGTISTSGGGGGVGGDALSGGGGGGSGGAVLLQANTVLISGIVTANGGGGGQGADSGTNAVPGNGGSTDSVMPAAGGLNILAGGDGGDGATPTVGALSGASTGPIQKVVGTGGGGGGHGVLRVVQEGPAS